ncbi:MlaD family protein [Nitrospirota bacterium]
MITESKAEIMVGAFALLVIFLLTLMTFRVGGLSLNGEDGYLVYAEFRNTAGLDAKTKVRIAGVPAGIIEKIELVEGKARVTMRIYPDIKLRENSLAIVRSSGLLGDKYVELSIGDSGLYLKNGNQITNVVDIAGMDDLMKDLSEIAREVKTLIREVADDETRENIRSLVRNLNGITEELYTALSDEDASLTVTLKKIQSAAETLDRTFARTSGPFTQTFENTAAITNELRNEAPELLGRLNNTLERLEEILDKAGPSIDSIVRNTDETMTSVREITEKVNRGEGTMGKLINDEKLYTSLTNAASGLGDTFGKMNQFRTYLTFKGHYLREVQEGKGIFHITLEPNPGKQYLIGFVSDPIGLTTTSYTESGGLRYDNTTVSRNLEFDVQFVNRFSNTAFKIGFFESTFGFGADQYLLKDRIKLSADAWDFDDREDGSDSPHLRIGGDFFLTRNLFFSGGMDNILNEDMRGGYLGGGVHFEDEDLKYLFGAIPSM